jgi:hypothetical protein
MSSRITRAAVSKMVDTPSSQSDAAQEGMTHLLAALECGCELSKTNLKGLVEPLRDDLAAYRPARPAPGALVCPATDGGYLASITGAAASGSPRSKRPA